MTTKSTQEQLFPKLSISRYTIDRDDIERILGLKEQTEKLNNGWKGISTNNNGNTTTAIRR